MFKNGYKIIFIKEGKFDLKQFTISPLQVGLFAGAIISRGIGEAKDKIKKMKECGITIAQSPSEIGKTLLNKLSN